MKHSLLRSSLLPALVCALLVVWIFKDISGQSPAQQAGIRMGDSLVAVNNQIVATNTDLASLTLTQQAGTKISLTVARAAPRQAQTTPLQATNVLPLGGRWQVCDGGDSISGDSISGDSISGDSISGD